jgi:hypothetical protein
MTTARINHLVRDPRAAALALLLTALASCAEHRVEHVAPDESRPHITWEIRRDRDRESVCGSAEPGRPCELLASTPGQPSSVAVHLFLHAAAQQTSYLGVMKTSFLEDVGALMNREVSITVPRGSRPVGVTLNARVSSRPGTYALSIALDATQAGDPASTRLSQEIAVRVVPRPPAQ